MYNLKILKNIVEAEKTFMIRTITLKSKFGAQNKYLHLSHDFLFRFLLAEILNMLIM